MSSRSHSPYEVHTIDWVFERINTIFFLPDIQREFRWDEKKVIAFFDSLLDGYPIGSILLWKQKVADYNSTIGHEYYRFISEVKATDNTGDRLTKPANDVKKAYLYAVLDGQQRLTSLYLALHGNGGYRVWRGKGRRSHSKTPPLRELYFSPAGRSGKKYTTQNEFCFFDEDNVPEGWFRVKDIYQAKNADSFCKINNLKDSIKKKKLELLHALLHTKEVIPCCVINDKSADIAVNVFLRLNSGGVPLKRTELLFALAINNWQDGRVEIEDYLRQIHDKPSYYGTWATIDKDFVLKACLYLYDKRISMSIDDLKKIDFAAISSNWVKIKESITAVLRMLNSKGHCSYTVKSINAILPLIYYRYHNSRYFSKNKVQKDLNAFFIVSQLTGLFSSSTDTALENVRKTMGSFTTEPFSFELFGERYSADNNSTDLICDKSIISSWLQGNDSYRKDGNTLLILSSLPEYHDKGNYYFEQDHLHPKKTFDNKDRRAELISKGIPETTVKDWEQECDTIGNLQLYRDTKNRNKSGKELAEWIKKNPGWKLAYDPCDEVRKDCKFNAGDDPYDIMYFDIFVKKRAELIEIALCRLLLSPKFKETILPKGKRIILKMRIRRKTTISKSFRKKRKKP